MIRILFVEDLEYEMELALSQLERAGLECVWRRVATEAELRSALEEFAPNIILSDFSLPQFDGLSALRIARELAPEIPFMFVSGTIGEERAIDALRRGAVDYVLKSNLARLASAVERAIADAGVRADRRRQEAQIGRLTRVLRMLSGINAVVPRISDRIELLREASRLAVTVGGYASAIVMMEHATKGIQSLATAGADEKITETLRASLEQSASRETSIIGGVLKNAKPFVCNETQDLDRHGDLQRNPDQHGHAFARGLAAHRRQDGSGRARARSVRRRHRQRRRAAHAARGGGKSVLRAAVPAQGHDGKVSSRTSTRRPG